MGNDYTTRQALKDEAYIREYRAWFAGRSPEEQKRLTELGLHEPLHEADGYGWGDTDASEFHEASEPPRLPPPEAGDAPVKTTAIENEVVLDILRRVLGELIGERNARLSLECLALATGFSYIGGTMTTIAQRHCVTRAAVSKRCVELIERLNLQPSRAMRSLTARRAYQAAQLHSRKQHELFGNHHE
jgi:hypothetical protein